MKQLVILSTVFIMFVLWSCNENSPMEPDSLEFDNPHLVSQDEALEISNQILGINGNSRSASMTPVCSYLYSHPKSRNNGVPEKLAYVFNYGDSIGWSVISTDDRLTPVLAYSDSGHFNEDNELVKNNFINYLDAYYLTKIDNEQSRASEDNSAIAMKVRDYVIKINLDQDAPFNKYIPLKVDTAKYTGCVAVASAYCMMYSKDTTWYHGNFINFNKAINALKEEQNKSRKIDLPPVIVVEPAIPYTYDVAVDKIAKLMSDFGDDIDMSYYPTSSPAKSSKARNQLYISGYPVSSLQWFNLENVLTDLDKNKIIYLEGQQPGSAHAWVCDGYTYSYDPLSSAATPIDYYLHMNWGWAGDSNGYYTGEVYLVYTLYQYFSVAVRPQWALNEWI